MTLFDKRTTQVLMTFLLFAALLGFVYLAIKPLLIFLFAMLFAYLLEPPIAYVERWTRSRVAAIVVVYVAWLALLALAGFLIGSRVIGEAHKLTQILPDLYQRISSGNIAWQLGAQRGWSQETQAELQSFLAGHREQAVALMSALGSKLALLAANAGWVGLVPILALFFLKSKSQLRDMVAGTFDDLIADRRKRQLLHDILQDLDTMLSHFVRAQLLLVLISGTAYTVFMASLRVPYAFALGAIGGLLEFIPMVGPLLAAVLILGISFSLNYPHLLVLVIFLGTWRLCTDYVISPRVLGGKVEISSLAVIFGVLVGGELAGVIGIYLAIPALATIRILWKHWLAYRCSSREPVPDATLMQR
jgi:predicted PurR-regulated permease PerM